MRTVINYVTPNGSAAQNVFFHEYTGPGTTDLEIVNSTNSWVLNTWGPAWQVIAAASAEIDNFTCDVLNLDGTVKRNLGGLGINLSGTSGASTGAAAVSAYLLAYTDLPKQRGSKYVPGMSEDEYNNNIFTPGALVDMAALLALYLGPILVGGSPQLTPGILSRTLTLFVEFIGNGLIDAQPAYQRRRKEGVGI